MKPVEPRLARRLWGLHPEDVDDALQALAQEHLAQMEVAHRRVDALRVEEANWALSIARLEERSAALRQSLGALERGRELAASYTERQLQLVSAELAERERFHQEQMAALRAEQALLRFEIAADRSALSLLADRLAQALRPPEPPLEEEAAWAMAEPSPLEARPADHALTETESPVAVALGAPADDE